MSAQADRLAREWREWSCGHDEPRGGAPWCVDCVLVMVRRITQLERDLRWVISSKRDLFVAPYSKELTRIDKIRKRIER